MLLDEDELIGRTIHNRYLVQKIIGRGAAGVVYSAQDTTQPLPLAIKAFFPKEASEFDTQLYNDLLQRFRREGSLIASLQHNHIVPVYEVGEYEGMAYFVMPYLNGGTLREKLQRQKALSLDETLLYMRQAASALDFVHFYHIVHRDVRPQNFLLTEDGRLVLSDFGVAHMVGSLLTQPGQLWGTEAYASPEVKRGEIADRRDDIYSLGVVLYELLTGNHPGMVNQPHTNIPARIASVIRKATAPRREERYASASALVEGLKRAIEGSEEEETTSSLEQEKAEGEETPQRTTRSTAGPSRTEIHIHLHRSHPRPTPTTSTRNSPRVVQRDISIKPTGSTGRFTTIASSWRWFQSRMRQIAKSGPRGSSRERTSRYASRDNSAFKKLSLRYFIPLLVSICVVLVALLGYSLPKPEPKPVLFSWSSSISVGVTTTQPTATPPPVREVMTVIQQYYANWNTRNYQVAYDLLQSDYKHAHPFEALLNSYKHTHYTCITIDSMNFLEDGTVQVTVTDNAIEDTLSGEGLAINRYTVDYLVKQEQSAWKLMPLSLQLNSAPGSCQAPTTRISPVVSRRHV